MSAAAPTSLWFRIGTPFGILIALVIGIWIGSPTETIHDHQAVPDQASQVWTCSMHPQIRMPKQGKCPICNMDLVPVEQEPSDGPADPQALRLSERAAKLARVRTSAAVRQAVSRPVRLFGEVDYDETRLAVIASWVNGRIERLYVDYTGLPVKRGDHLVQLYSPELLSTQRELLSAARSAKRFASGDTGLAARAARALLNASSERLRLWGLNKAQIDRIVERGRPSERITIYAPIGGVVIDKQGKEGMYVQTGTRLYTIADLSTVWIQFKAYESDLPWLRYGQRASIRVTGMPGEVFEGNISFLDPLVDQATRTARVRVILDNADGRLRPGMYARGEVQVGLDDQGSVLAPDLSGKWISPMHPEVIRDGPGRCPVCGMPLQRAEALGLAGQSKPGQPPLTIPATAPLITGKRALVYVACADCDQPTYTGREVVLGPKAGELYVVIGGLAEGEQVVVEGNFLLDSAMQLQAKPSMMSPTGGPPPSGHHHGSGLHVTAPAPEAAKPSLAPAPFRNGLGPVLEVYLSIQRALAEDDFEAAHRAALGLKAPLAAIDPGLLVGQSEQRWLQVQPGLVEQAAQVASAGDLTSLRQAFSPLSNSLVSAVEDLGGPEGKALFKVHCPMAFDNTGAWWLQDEEQVANPYFGASMLRCADVVEAIGKDPR